MGRRFEIDYHPKRARIVTALVRGDPYSQIAKRYGTSKAALSRYMNKCLRPRAAKVLAMREIRDGEDYVAALDQITERVRKMYDACDEYLQDPDDPDKYYLGPRAEDIEIIYIHRNTEGKTDKRKANFHDLLEEAMGEDKIFVGAHYKHADPRKLLLDTAKTLNEQLKLLATIRGQIKELTINISNNPVFLQFQQMILNATASHPEARKRIIDALRTIDTSHGQAIPGGS